MKNLVLVCICLLVSVLSFAQVQFPLAPTGAYSASQSAATVSYWQLSGAYVDASGGSDAESIQVGDVVSFTSGAYVFFLPIISVEFASGSSLIVRVDRTGITEISSVPGGNKAIYRGNEEGLFPFIAGLSDGDQQAVMSYNMKLIADKLGGSCKSTITQTAHAFSPWTPVVWNGSEYERPTNDTIIPDYIVVDSVDANTFKVASCGIYTTSLTNGTYWYTNEAPGYSLTQDTVKVPLFNVVQGKLSLRPLVGFNLGVSSGGSSSGGGIYSGTDSLSQTNTLAKMANDRSQNFGIGRFSSFPDWGDLGDYGLFISPGYNEQSGLVHVDGNMQSLVYVQKDDAKLIRRSKIGDNRGSFVSVGNGRLSLGVGSGAVANKNWSIIIDTTKFEISRNISGTTRIYQLLPPSQYPSTTNGITNILKWTGNGSSAVPSFGVVPNIYTTTDSITSLARYVKMSKSQDLGIGYFPAGTSSFLDLDYNGTEYGFFLGRNGWGSSGIIDGTPNQSVAALEVGQRDISYGSIAISGNPSRPYGQFSSHLVRGENLASPSATWVARTSSFRQASLNGAKVGNGLFFDGFRNGYVANYYTSPRSTLDRYGVLLGRDSMGLSRGGGQNEMYFNTIQNTNPTWTLFQNVGGPSTTKHFKWIEVTMPENDTTGNGIRLYEKYDFPNATPSATAGRKQLMQWTAGVPSFGYRYETDSIYSDVNVKMDNTKTLAIGNFASFPSLGYDGTDAGLYLSEYNGSMNLAYGDALMDVFDDSFRFGVYDFTGTASGDFVQLILSKSTNQISFAGDNGTPYSYAFPKTNPSATSGAISSLSWTAGTPSFLRSQHGVATGTTDGSGDLTITFAAAMPDATYSLIATVEGTTSYTISVHTKATGTCKVRFFNPATGAAVTATSVTISYEAKDY